MTTQLRKDRVTFRKPFVLSAFGGVFPAGDYELEWEQDILDGIALPDCLRTSVLIHLHVSLGSPGLAQTLTVPWDDLEIALAGDRTSQEQPADPYFDRMLSATITRLVMRSDDVSEADVRGVMALARARKAMIAEGTTLVLSTDSDLFKFLKGMDPDGTPGTGEEPETGGGIARRQ